MCWLGAACVHAQGAAALAVVLSLSQPEVRHAEMKDTFHRKPQKMRVDSPRILSNTEQFTRWRGVIVRVGS